MSTENALLEALAAEFRQAWQKESSRPDLNAFLGRCSVESREQLARLLFPIEVEKRLGFGDKMDVDNDYFSLDAGLRHMLAAVLHAKERAANSTARHGEDSNFSIETGTAEFTQSTARERTVIGPYKLIQILGEGGMGSVWLAEQREPVKRRVALKLIRSNIGSKEVLARFEAERQALAMMNHPNVSRIIDAGTTPEGLPFFAMELVQGESLTKYCDQNRLDIQERLKLFGKVCAGVQHAHQKGIIHRDLKPSNILVTLVDGQPVPKVIDFGLAKAVEPTLRLTDQSLFTYFGQVLGTVKYMSPEQAGLNELDVDTRTDIYSLGVVLYELLTGSTPLDDDSLRKVVGIKMLEAVRDYEPIKPSSRLSNASDEKLSSVTSSRRTDGARLSRILAGDLDWIVMKSLDKDRTRRYDSASSLASDIQRFLDSEPVVARPPSWRYLAAKFLKKNRGFAVAAGLLFLALAAGLTGTSWGLMKALEAEREASTLAASEKEAKGRVEVESAKRMLALESEKSQREYAEAISRFVIDDFLALTSVEGQLRFSDSERSTLHRRSTLKDLLDRAADKLSRREDLDQQTEAELCWIIGVSYRSIGDIAGAIKFLERCRDLREDMGQNHLNDLIQAKNSLAVAYRLADDDRESALFEDAWQQSIQVNGEGHPTTIAMKSHLAESYAMQERSDDAVKMLEECLVSARESLGETHRATLGVMTSLAALARQRGEVETAIERYNDALKLNSAAHGENSFWSLDCMEGLALAHRDNGNLQQAAQIMEDQLELCRSLLGPDHPSTNDSLSNLGIIYIDLGRHEESAKLFEESLDWTVRNLGESHGSSLVTLTNLSTVYGYLGRPNEALEMQEKTLKVIIANKGADDPMALGAMNSLAITYRSLGRLDEALAMSLSALEVGKKVLGEHHVSTLVLMTNLARSYDLSNRPQESMKTYEVALELLKEHAGDRHPATLACAKNLAAVYGNNGREEEALELFQSTLTLLRESLGDSHLNTLACKWELAQLYQREKQGEKAVILIKEIYDTPDRPIQFANAGWHLVKAYVANGNHLEAKQLIEVLLSEIRDKNQSDPLLLGGTLSQYAGILLDIEAFDEAEKLLRESFDLSLRADAESYKTFYIQTLLGEAIWGKIKLSQDQTSETSRVAIEEAVRTLSDGYEELKKRRESIPQDNIQETLMRPLEILVELSNRSDNSAELKRWSNERDWLKGIYSSQSPATPSADQ